jgi:hypothetical protein
MPRSVSIRGGARRLEPRNGRLRRPSELCELLLREPARAALLGQGEIREVRSAEKCSDLGMLREVPRLLLGEDQLTLREHVELPVAARLDLGLVLGLCVQLGRETRSPLVVAVSDWAVEDAHASHRETLRPRVGSDPTIAARSRSRTRPKAPSDHSCDTFATGSDPGPEPSRATDNGRRSRASPGGRLTTEGRHPS